MKRLVTHSILVFVCFVFGTAGSFAQMYSNPEPADKSPLQIKKGDALAEASSVSKSCGYNQAYISKEDLDALLSLSRSVGIRIYNAKETTGQSNCDIIAVAVDEAGKEIGATFSSKYVHTESFDDNKSCPSKRISKSKASGCVSNVLKTDLNYQKVFFSKSTIDARWNVSGATGIKLIPGQLSGGSTIMIMASQLTSGELKELEASYLKSQLPCPTDCGDSGNYLVAPN